MYEDPNTKVALGFRRVTAKQKMYLECFIPATSCENAILSVDPFYGFDRRVMLGYLRGLTSANVEHASGIVSTSGKNFVASLYRNETV